MKCLIYILLFISLSSCFESKFQKEIIDLSSQINKIDSLNTELASMNFTIGEEAYKSNKYALCSSPKFEDCYVSDYKKAIERLYFEAVYKRKKDSVNLLLHEFNYQFEYLSKPKKGEEIKNENIVNLHYLINEFVTETNNPTADEFLDYKSKINSLKQNINTLKADLKN